MKSNIQFCDLSLPADSEILIWQKAKEVIQRNAYILGDEVHAFENEFAQYCDTTECIGVATGCDALLWTMEALGIGNGDEVITVANTFIGTVLPIIRSGATPVLVDCDPITQQIDPQAVDAAITSKTAAIVAVHLYGRLAPMNELIEISEKNGLLLLEDAAQAHGARYKGKRAGSMGTAAGFSFYPAKNLGAWGDGGAVTTNDSTLANKVDKIRNYGQVKKYLHAELGWNSRLDTFQAVVLSEKLKLLDQWNQKRRIVANWYYDKLKDSEFSLFFDDSDNEPVHHLFVISCAKRRVVEEKLKMANIPSGIHYPYAIHQHKCFADKPFAKDKSFPNAERQAKELISLPMHPHLKKIDVEKICTILRSIK